MKMQRRLQTKRLTRASKRRIVLLAFAALLASYFLMVNRVISNHAKYAAPRPMIRQEAIPPLDHLVQGWNITGNVSWLMDFAIIGFPKTGTSTLMFYLEQYKDSIFTFPDERCELGWNQHVKLIRAMYREYQPQRRMGIKCPNNLEVDLALANFNKFFPTTKFIVGLRHPVLWFESLYNFRVKNGVAMGMPAIPPAERLIGKCARPNQGVCTNRGNFSNHLVKIETWRKVFLYHVDQLKETSHGPTFRHDLGSFLEVFQPLSKPMIWYKPGPRDLTNDQQIEIKNKIIDICHEKYSKLRETLMAHSTKSAKWIQNTFLLQPNVVVSDRDYFVKGLDSWRSDPCISRAMLSN